MVGKGQENGNKNNPVKGGTGYCIQRERERCKAGRSVK